MGFLFALPTSHFALRSIAVAFFQFANTFDAFGVSTGADGHVFLLHFELFARVCVCTRNYVISVPHYVPRSPLSRPSHWQQIETAAASDCCPPLSTHSRVSGRKMNNRTETRTRI